MFRWFPIMTSWRKVINNHGCFVSTHTFVTMIIEESVCFMLCEPIFFCNYSYVVWYSQNIFFHFFFINWTVCMSDNLPERVQILGHAHIICIIVWENRIICCQIFCDLLLKSAFDWIFNVIELILVKIKWHIKWKYLIQKFHDICLSYYFNISENIVIREVEYRSVRNIRFRHLFSLSQNKYLWCPEYCMHDYFHSGLIFLRFLSQIVLMVLIVKQLKNKNIVSAILA